MELKLETNELKRCSACTLLKSVNEFYVNKTKKSGLHNQCKVCTIKTNNVKVECECGITVQKNNLKVHQNRPIHYKWLKFKPERDQQSI